MMNPSIAIKFWWMVFFCQAVMNIWKQTSSKLGFLVGSRLANKWLARMTLWSSRMKNSPAYISGSAITLGRLKFRLLWHLTLGESQVWNTASKLVGIQLWLSRPFFRQPRKIDDHRTVCHMYFGSSQKSSAIKEFEGSHSIEDKNRS